MRSLWLHYPKDETARKTADEFLWGRDMLIAPVYEKNATTRKLYLPQGQWYDWWTNTKQPGGQTILRSIDLSIMPIYVRAGAIIPFDPIRQYTAEVVKAPTTLKIYTGADGSYTLYEDDGISMDYLKGNFKLTSINWNNSTNTLTILPGNSKNKKADERIFKVELIPQGVTKEVTYSGNKTEIFF